MVSSLSVIGLITSALFVSSFILKLPGAMAAQVPQPMHFSGSILIFIFLSLSFRASEASRGIPFQRFGELLNLNFFIILIKGISPLRACPERPKEVEWGRNDNSTLYVQAGLSFETNHLSLIAAPDHRALNNESFAQANRQDAPKYPAV